MSTKGGTDEATRLAREEEKAAVARAKAELEAEREAMRAELAAIEEEERIEADRVKKAAIAGLNSSSEASSESPSASPAPVSGTPSTSKSAAHPTRTPKSSRHKTSEEDQKAENSTPSTSAAISEVDSKADRKDKKDKKKDKVGTNGEAIAEATPKQDRKKDRGETKPSTGSESPATHSIEASVASPKAEKKDKKDKKLKSSSEGAAGSSLSAADVPSPSAEPKESKDRPKKTPTPSVPHDADNTEASKKPKDKTKTKDKSGKAASSDGKDDGDKKDKVEKSDRAGPSEKSGKGEKTDKADKKPKKDRGISSSVSGSPPVTSPIKDRTSASTGKSTLVLSDNQIPTAKDTEDAASQKSGPRPLTRVESNLKIPVLDLSNRRITELPLDIGQCTYLTKLYLSRNQLNDISSLAPLVDLQVLSVSNNSLTSFPVELCSPSSKMKDLALADNRISSIPTSPANFKLPSLTKLDLMGNKMTEIPAAITSVATLTSLNMAWNQITEIPKGISNLVLLTSLILHHNSIKRVASGVCQLSKLTTLELQDNSLVSIPESIAELSSLTTLDVARNQLKEWPTAFTSNATLPALIKLDLSHNQISGALVGDRFPEDSSIFPVIEEIYLNHNSITELPTMFWRQITNASVIDLRNNRLTSLSEEIEGFFSLSSLEVGGNLLGSLPSQLGQLGSLQVLSFYNNLITELPDLSSLEYLQYLNAGHNQLSEISLEGLSSLEEVFLSGNPIKQLPDNISETCPNLKLLFAADMALKKVPTGLNGLSLLEQIDFSHNRITEIPPALGDLESLRSMSFAHNKLETSKEREVLKTPGKGPWDCIEFWQGFIQILEIDLSHNKLKYVPKGLETKFGTECEVVLIGNPLAETTESKSIFLTPQLGKRYQVGWSEMLGRRPTMEDHFLWQGALDGHNHVDLFAVFDGHAARDAAKFCSEHLPELVKQQLSSEHIKGGNGAKLTKSDKFFHTIFANLNAALEKHLSTVRDSSVKHCGTTAVVVLIVGDTMQIANVGDSRAVLNNGERCTVDHKPRAEVDRIRSHTGGFVTGDGSGRINEVLAVSRSLGDFYMHPWVISEPHIYSRTLLKEDKFIILACDGIWDEVEDQDAVAIVEPLVQEGELFKAASKLRDIAYCAGSDDNISVMIIKLNK